MPYLKPHVLDGLYLRTINVKEYRKYRTNQDIKRHYSNILKRRTGANSAISILMTLMYALPIAATA